MIVSRSRQSAQRPRVPAVVLGGSGGRGTGIEGPVGMLTGGRRVSFTGTLSRRVTRGMAQPSSVNEIVSAATFELEAVRGPPSTTTLVSPNSRETVSSNVTRPTDSPSTNISTYGCCVDVIE